MPDCAHTHTHTRIHTYSLMLDGIGEDWKIKDSPQTFDGRCKDLWEKHLTDIFPNDLFRKSEERDGWMDGQQRHKARTDIFQLTWMPEHQLGGSDINHQPNRKCILYSWKRPLCSGHWLFLYRLCFTATVVGGATTVASFRAHCLWHQNKEKGMGKPSPCPHESPDVD